MKIEQLNKLYRMQQELDKRIELNHPVKPKEDRLKKIKVALSVELGEAMNEYRKFKFWSDDQETRHKALLEELVDCLHFILSIGLRIKANNQVIPAPVVKEIDVEQTFLDVISVDWEKDYDLGFDLFLGFAQLMGYSAVQLYHAYFDKNAINHKRQEEGY